MARSNRFCPAATASQQIQSESRAFCLQAVHGGGTVAAGGFFVMGNDTAATADWTHDLEEDSRRRLQWPRSEPNGAGPRVAANELVGVYDVQRRIVLGGPVRNALD